MRRCVLLGLLMLTATGLAGAAEPPARRLAQIIALADDQRWTAATEALRALFADAPSWHEPWLVLYEMEGRGTESPRFFTRRAARQVRAEMARLGDALPAPTRAWIEVLLAGARAPLTAVRAVEGQGPWGRFVALRRRLLWDGMAPADLSKALEAVWVAGARLPTRFYLADELARLPRLSEALRREYRVHATAAVRTVYPQLALRYQLPYPRKPLGTFDFELDAARCRELFAWADRVGAASYTDDLLFQLAGAQLQQGRQREARRILWELAEGPYCNYKRDAFRALYEGLARSNDGDSMLQLVHRLQAELERWPEDVTRLSPVGVGAYAFNHPEATNYLIGWTHSERKEWRQAIHYYEIALAQSKAARRGIPPNIWDELARFYEADGQHRKAFDTYDHFSQLDEGTARKDRWFLLFLRAAPAFMLSVGLSSLHMFLLMLTAGVLLFSRAAFNRPYFLPALGLALIFTAGQTVFLIRLEFEGLRAFSLALGVGAAIFLPAATGRAHHAVVCRPDWNRGAWSGWLLAIGLAAALMFGWTVVQLMAYIPRHSPFMRFMSDLPMFAPVAELISGKEDKLLGSLLVALAGLQEEVLYRGFTLALLARYLAPAGSTTATRTSWWTAQVVTAVLWAVAHAGMTEPMSWKFIHVGMLSLVLGELFRRKGLYACIVCHAGFNVFVLNFGNRIIGAASEVSWLKEAIEWVMRLVS